MTTLNTIIEEEKKEFDEIALYSDGTIHMGGSRIDKLMTWFTSAMQRAYEAGQKEGRESLIKMFSVAIEADIKTAQKINMPIMVAGKALVETLRRTELDAVIEKIKQ